MHNNIQNTDDTIITEKDVEFVDFTYRIEIVSSDNYESIAKWFKNDLTKTLPEVIKEFIKENQGFGTYSLKSIYLTKFSRFKKEGKRKCLTNKYRLT